jgi:1-deoxy-D-xylulose-5-phosphate synthase
MLYTAFELNKPVAIRYSRSKVKYQENNPKKIKLGTWEMLEEGKDATIITYGDFIENAIEIREKLKQDKIDVGIVNARYIKPFDKSMLNEILNTNKPIFIYEEVSSIGSLGERLCAYAQNNNYKANIKCFAIEDKFIEQGNRNKVLEKLELDVDSIYSKIKDNL